MMFVAALLSIVTAILLICLQVSDFPQRWRDTDAEDRVVDVFLFAGFVATVLVAGDVIWLAIQR